MNSTIVIYSLISFFILYLIAKISYKLNLVDLPNKRKIHKKPTAYTGGLAISCILIVSILLLNISVNSLNLILSLSFLISLVGFIDDKYGLNVGGKLSLQIFPIIYLVIFESLYLTQIGDFGYFKLELGTFNIPFTLLSVLFLINAFNYFDGIDGILSSVSICVLCILYFLSPDQNIRLFILIIFIPLVFFLCFNFSLFKLPKLFLGDSGSWLLGYIISFLLIYLAKQNMVHPILLAWSITIFVYEFISINLIRIKNKKDIFKAGQDHLHHLILNKTNSILFANIFMFLLNMVFFVIGYLSFLMISPLVSLALFFLLFVVFILLRIKI